jgi:regulator of protease activity HflC (stomatin/prohibitin superfamily)
MCCCIDIINTSEVALVERFGKFTRLAEPGLLCLCWPFDEKAGTISIRVQELKVSGEAKTKDNVFVSVSTSVQFKVVNEKVYQAHYVLANARRQMTAYVDDVIRSTIPTMTLDEAFESKVRSLKLHRTCHHPSINVILIIIILIIYYY